MKNVGKRFGSLLLVLSMLLSLFTVAAAAQPAGALHWWTDDGLVRTKDTAPEPAQARKDLTICAARNEYEGQQIVVNCPTEDFTITGVSFTHLSNRDGFIHKTNLSYHFALYEIKQETITGFGDPKVGSFQGAILQTYPYSGTPDPLSNERSIDVRAGKNQPIFISLYVPETAAPGAYYGTVTVHTTLGDLEVPLKAEIFDVTIPDASQSNFTCLNWDFNVGQGVTRPWNVIKNYYGAEIYSPEFYEILDNFVELEGQYRQNAAIISAVFALDDGNTTVDPDGTFHFDWTRFDELVDHYLSAGQITRLAGMHVGYGNGDGKTHNSCYRLKDDGTGNAVAVFEPYLTAPGNNYEDKDNWYGQYLPALTEHLLQYDITQYPQFAGTDKTCLFDIWLQHLCDEPTNQRYYATVMNLVKQYMVKTDEQGNVIGRVKTLDAENSAILINHKAIGQSVDIWVPKPSIYENNKAKYKDYQMNQGDELWNYVCIGPPKPWLNRFLGQADTVYPLLFWYFAKENVTGYLHYAINGWCLGWWGDGDTYVTYPDPAHKTMMTSIRYNGQRDGMEDYELFQAAKASFPEQTAALLNKAIPHPAGSYIQSAQAFRPLRYALLQLASGDGNIHLDGIADPEIQYGPELPEGAYYLDNKDKSVTFQNSGAAGENPWTRFDHNSPADSYEQSVHYTILKDAVAPGTEGGTCTATFSGTGVGAMLECSTNTGDAKITLTNSAGEVVDQQTVSTFSPNRLTYHTVYEKTGLPKDDYTLTVTHVKPDRPGDSWLIVDTFVVHTRQADGQSDLVEVRLQQSANGTISVDRTQVLKGESLTITTAPAANYYCRAILVNGQPMPLIGGVYVVENVQEDLLITAEFAPAPTDNLAYQKQASVNNPGWGNPDPNNVTDGVTASGNVSNDSVNFPLTKTPFEVTIDLGQVYQVDTVAVFMQNYYRQGFEILYRADAAGDWSLAGTSGDNWELDTTAPANVCAVTNRVTLDQPVEAAQIMIRVDGSRRGGANANIVNLYEIEVFGVKEEQTVASNVCLGKPVTTSSIPMGGEQAAAILTDGERDTAANLSNDPNTNPTNAAPFQAVVDLQGRYELTQLTAYINAWSYLWVDYEIYARDGADREWVKVTGSAYPGLCTNTAWNTGHANCTFSMTHTLNEPLIATHLMISSVPGTTKTQSVFRELEALGKPVSVDTSREALQQAVAEAEQVDGSLYTVSSFSAFTEALDQARRVLYDAHADQAAYEAQVQALQLAREALQPSSETITLRAGAVRADGLTASAAFDVAVTGAVKLVLRSGGTETELPITENTARVSGLTHGNSYVLAAYDAAGSSRELAFTTDLQAPVVTGVTADEIVRQDRVTLRITDDRLQTVTLNDRPLQIRDHMASVTVTENGSYTLCARDLVGNETTLTFMLANKANLYVYLKESEDFRQSDYTAASWENLERARAAAKAAAEDPIADAAAIEEAVTALRQAMAALEPALAKPDITDAGRSLSLDDVIYINNYASITGFDGMDPEKNGGMLIWNQAPETVDAATADVVREGLLKGADKDGNVIYGQRTDGIAAKEYADEVWMAIYVRDAAGNETYGPVTRYSVRDYCLSAIENNAAVKETAIELLHFGAAAQVNFNYNTANLADAGAAEGAPWNEALLTPVAAVPENNFTASEAITLRGRSLSLDGKIMANFYFDTELVDDNATLLVWNNISAPLTEDNAAVVKMVRTSTGYAAQALGFAADEYENTVYVCARLTDADGTVHYSEVVPFSAEGYAALALQRSSEAALRKTVQQMVLYGEKARTYLNAIPEAQ